MRTTVFGIAASSWLVALGVLALTSVSGCMRDDPAPSAVDPQSRQQLEMLQRQLESLSDELRTSGGNSRGGGDASELIARLAVLEDRAVRDADFLTLRNEVEKLAEVTERLASDLAEQGGRLDGLAQLERDYDRLAARLQDTGEQQRGLDERLEKQTDRMRGLETQLLARINDYLEAVESGPVASDPRQQERIEQLEEELAQARAEQESLEELLSERERELRRSNTTIDRLSERIDRLEEQLRGEGLDPGAIVQNDNDEEEAEEEENDADIPPSVRDGAYTGRLRLMREESMLAIISFPLGTPRTEGQRFNIFNEEGRKIANFVVVNDSTPEDLEGQEIWLGGRVEPLPERRLPRRGDRASNLDSLPESVPDTDNDGHATDELDDLGDDLEDYED